MLRVISKNSLPVKAKIATVAIVVLFVFSCPKVFAIQPQDCNCSKESILAPEDKLLNSEKIFNDFLQGSEKVKVIVNLKRPEMLTQKKVNWRSKYSLKQLHSEVKNRQDKVINVFTSRQLTLRSRFENQAGFSCEVTSDALDKLLADPNVESVEPVEILQPHLAQGIPLMNGSIYRSTYYGQGIAIAICDTGIDYTHLMLGGGGFPNSKVIGGYDFGDSDSDPFPSSSSSGHGTCTAGIAAGSLGSVGDYIGGVACGAKIYALKVENSSEIIYSDRVISAWDWCTSHKNDDPCNPILVISTSLGSGSYSSYCDSSQTAYAAAANNATSAGITILVSSGNDGFCSQISSPACLTNTIAVGAVYDAAFGSYSPCISSTSCATKSPSSSCSTGYYATDSTAADKVTSYSNTASILDIFAPSNQAYTTDMTGSAGYSTGDYYSSFGGTSAAAPYAAGAVACIQSAAKIITGNYLTPAQVKEILTSTGDPITDGKVAITKPRVNIAATIDTIQPPPPQGPCTDVTIGTGTTTWNYPMHTQRQYSRTQVIYLASEIGHAGNIQSLSLNVSVVPSQTMNNWTIRMKHTPLSSYTTCSLDSTGWTTVYQADEPVGTTGWRTFIFEIPFAYNGTDNLMIDFSHNNTSHNNPSGSCFSSAPGSNRSVYDSSNYNGAPLNWSGTFSCSTNVPNIRLSVCCDVLPGDLQPDCNVDIADLSIMAAQWLDSPGSPSVDIAPQPVSDGIVNFLDFTELASYWLQ